MTKLKYTYKTRITFNNQVHAHSFLLRCVPISNEWQDVVSSSCTISPDVAYNKDIDSFGNVILNGHIADLHNYFEFVSEGVVIVKTYCLSDKLNPIYLYPSKFTTTSIAINNLYDSVVFSENATALEKILLLSDALHAAFSYEPGVTNIQTLASEALEIGKGVCQDFAHIMITLCRKAKIPARYITGFMLGEGFTHAWIEYYADGFWYGFDPTHNRAIIKDGYIKLAHGRDYQDCTVDKGMFVGLTHQTLEVSLKVEEMQQ